MLTDEAIGGIRGVGITLGTQLYYGTSADTKGFQGLKAFTGTGTTGANALTVTASGTGSVVSSVYLVYLDLKGVHFVAGRTATASAGGSPALPSGVPNVYAPPFRMPEWTRQQVVIGTAGKVAFANVTNFAGWLGLAYGSNYSCFRARNVSAASAASYFTDALAAKLLSQVPLHVRNSGSLKWFMNRTAAYTLQISRSVVTPSFQSGGPTGQLLAAPIPTECMGIPIQITDSILQTDTAD